MVSIGFFNAFAALVEMYSRGVRKFDNIFVRTIYQRNQFPLNSIYSKLA